MRPGRKKSSPTVMLSVQHSGPGQRAVGIAAVVVGTVVVLVSVLVVVELVRVVVDVLADVDVDNELVEAVVLVIQGSETISVPLHWQPDVGYGMRSPISLHGPGGITMVRPVVVVPVLVEDGGVVDVVDVRVVVGVVDADVDVTMVVVLVGATVPRISVVKVARLLPLRPSGVVDVTFTVLV